MRQIQPTLVHTPISGREIRHSGAYLHPPDYSHFEHGRRARHPRTAANRKGPRPVVVQVADGLPTPFPQKQMCDQIFVVVLPASPVDTQTWPPQTQAPCGQGPAGLARVVGDDERKIRAVASKTHNPRTYQSNPLTPHPWPATPAQESCPSCMSASAKKRSPATGSAGNRSTQNRRYSAGRADCGPGSTCQGHMSHSSVIGEASGSAPEVNRNLAQVHPGHFHGSLKRNRRLHQP